MNRVFDALVTAAAADVARHRLAYLVVAGFRVIHQKCGGLHDLAGLAEAALRDVHLTPGLLHRVVAGRMKSFDGSDVAADHVGNRCDAGANRLLVDDHRARAAQRLTAAILGAGQAGFVAQIPEQREIRVAIPAFFPDRLSLP